MRRLHPFISATVVGGLLVAISACGGDGVASVDPTPTAEVTSTSTPVVEATAAPDEPSATPVEAAIIEPTMKPDDTVVIDVAFVGGVVAIDDDRVSVSVGDMIELRVVSDVAEELHVHTYDRLVEVAPGEVATLRFEADIVGISEVEFEQSGAFVMELEVR